MKNIIYIIPAQDRNNYSTQGDLASWGNSTLLDWKISQILEVGHISNVYVSTNSKKIFKYVKERGINVFLRKRHKHLREMYQEAGKKFPNKDILWANPSSPYISAKTIKKIIKLYLKKKPKDGIVSSKIFKEYIFSNKNKPYEKTLMNFLISRKEIKLVYILSNGIYLSNAKNYLKGKPFGEKPLHFNLNWLSSLEIKTSEEINIYKILLDEYMKQEF